MLQRYDLNKLLWWADSSPQVRCAFGNVFYLSALKMTKCQTLRKFWHLELFWWELLCNLTLNHFLGWIKHKIVFQIPWEGTAGKVTQTFHTKDIKVFTRKLTKNFFTVNVKATHWKYCIYDQVELFYLTEYRSLLCKSVGLPLAWPDLVSFISSCTVSQQLTDRKMQKKQACSPRGAASRYS